MATTMARVVEKAVTKSGKENLECCEMKNLLQNALMTLLDLQPENPLEYLALHYEWEPETTSVAENAVQLIKQNHYANPDFSRKLHRAYLILSQNPTQKGLKGFTGDIHMNVLQILTENLEEKEVCRLLDRLYCRPNDVVPFSVFRSSVETSLIFKDYLVEANELYELLDFYEEGQARKSICNAVLTRLWQASTQNGENENEARKWVSDENDLELLVTKTKSENITNEKRISREKFVSQAVDIFLMKISNTNQ